MSTLKDKAGAQKTAARTFAAKIRRARAIHAVVTFALLVLTPTAVSTAYLYTYAANQYATEFRFAVRGRQEGGGANALGVMLGAGSALASSSDSFIVVDYMKSLEMIRELSQRLDLDEMYSRPAEDPVHRYGGSPASEDFLDYWEWQIDAEFDLSRGIITTAVWSFSPEDSLSIAEEVLALNRELVDQLSREARQEALAYADEQVAMAAGQLRQTRLDIQDFRTRERVIDPTADALRMDQQIALLERTIIELITERDTQIATKGARSASAQQLQERIDAARRQLALVKESIDQGMPEQAREFESLQTEHEIARETYAAALRARHEAEGVATQRQVYLSVYDTPKLAQTSLYPDRPLLILVIFALSFGVWGIVYVVTLNIRDASM